MTDGSKTGSKTTGKPKPTPRARGQSVISEFRRALSEVARKRISNGERSAGIYMRLRGLDNGLPESLRKTAAHYDLSAERVRQIADSVSQQVIPRLLEDAPWFADVLPALDEALAVIRMRLPASEKAISARLVAMDLAPGTCDAKAGIRLLKGREKASAIARIADLLGRNPGIVSQDWDGHEGLTVPEAPNCFRPLLTHARKIVAASGAAHPDAIAESFSQASGLAISAEEVQAILAPFFKEIDHDGETWIFFPGAGNDALVRARNRVGSFGQCSLGRLSFVRRSDDPGRAEEMLEPEQAGLNRGALYTRSRYQHPVPSAVIAQLLTLNGFVVDGDRITQGTTRANGRKNTIASVQGRMVGVLRAMAGADTDTDVADIPPVAQPEFIKECLRQGMSPGTVRVYLYRSGLFRCENGVCCLAP